MKNKISTIDYLSYCLNCTLKKKICGGATIEMKLECIKWIKTLPKSEDFLWRIR